MTARTAVGLQHLQHCLQEIFELHIQSCSFESDHCMTQQVDPPSKEEMTKEIGPSLKPIKWKKLASRELQAPEVMKLRSLMRRVLLAAGKSDSKEHRDVLLKKLSSSSQFRIEDGFVRLQREQNEMSHPKLS